MSMKVAGRPASLWTNIIFKGVRVLGRQLKGRWITELW